LYRDHRGVYVILISLFPRAAKKPKENETKQHQKGKKMEENRENRKNCRAKHSAFGKQIPDLI